MPNVKGSNVLAAVKMLRANRERALQLLAPKYHRFLTERITVASWYPEEDQIELLRVVASMLPRTPDPWMMMGRIAARGDLTNLYSYLVKPGGELKDTLRAATALWQTFHDTGELKIALEAPGSAIATVRNYAASCREMCRVIGGYVTEVASVAGALNVATVKLGCVHDGAPQCSWRMNFR
jgi:hypothetical protein